MNAHEEWLRNNGLSSFLDNIPEFKKYCIYDESKAKTYINEEGNRVVDNSYEYCCYPCPYEKECDEWLSPVAEAVKKYNEIGEV